MATCCTEQEDSRVEFALVAIMYPAGFEVRERERKGVERAREGLNRSGNSVKVRSFVEAVPHSANSGNCSREISNMSTSRTHTARNSIRGTDSIDGVHCGPSFSPPLRVSPKDRSDAHGRPRCYR